MKNQNSGQSNVKIFKRAARHFAALPLMACLVTFLQVAHAGSYYWDPQGLAGPSDGSGNWDDQTVSNWWTGNSSTTWTNLPANPNGGNSTNAIIGAGVLGTYYITNINPVEATTLTFSNAGSYTISGNQLGVMTPSSFNGPVLISLPNTTNTISANGTANLGLVMNQGNDISNAPNSVLTLSSGLYEYGGNPRFEGVNMANSTVNLTGGTVSDSTSASTFQVSGITMNITNAIFNATARLDISRNAVQSAAQAATTINVYNGGQLNANTKAGSNSGNHLQLTRTGGETILNVYSGGLVSTVGGGFSGNNINTAGNIRILPDSGGQATLNILGGTVLAGVGANVLGSAGTWNQYLTTVTFFDSNPTLNVNSLALLNMQSGSLTAYAITFGAPGGTSTGPTNGINVKGGTLYLGAGNISHPASTGTNFSVNLSGGTVAAIQNWSSPCSVPINLTNVNGNITFQTADIGGSPFNMAFSGPFTGTGGFNLIGGGTLTLSGPNNYSGASVISNGTLVVSTASSPAGGALTLEGGPTVSIQVASGLSWTIGNLTYDTGTPTADFYYDGFNPGTRTPAIQVNGNLSFNVTPLATAEGTAIPDGIYPLVKYTGTLSGTPPTTVIINGSSTIGYISNNITAKAIELVVTNSSVSTPLTWGVGNGVWDTSTPNWSKNGLSSIYADGDAVQFDDTASGPFPITVTVAKTVVSPGSITVTAAGNYTIAGPGAIGGSGGLIKSSSGTLTLSGTNTYSGGTAISGGTVDINFGGNSINNSAIGTGLLTIGGANIDNTSGKAITLLPQEPELWNGGWTFVGTTNLNLGTGSVTLTNGVLPLNVVSNILEVDGQIGDLGYNYGIEKVGAGTLVLSNANTFSGGMNVAAGTLVINNAGAVGTGTLTLAATIDNQSGAPITLTGPSTISMYSFTFLGTANLDLGSAPITVQSATLNVSNNTLTVEGDLNGSSTAITKNGPGALTIDGTGNSGSVAFTINAGTVYADRDFGFPTFGVTQPITVNSNGALVVLNPSGTQFNQNSLILNGGLVELNGDSETVGNVNFNSGILSDSSQSTPAALSLVAGDTLTLGGVADFNVTNSASLTINGVVAGANSSAVLLVTGGGTLVLATNMTYIGNTTISNGTLSIVYPNLPTNGTVTINANAVLNLNFTNSVTNIVTGLILNGVTASLGVHNASTDPTFITGIGSLLVVPPPINPYPGTIQFSVSGNMLNLAWPTNAGWLLQAQTNSLLEGISSNWVTVPGSGSLTNLSVTMNPTNGTTFFRMVHP